MKANELRIGNYLLNDGVTVKIDARSIFDIWDDAGLKNHKPIPLTKEWLVKFGFDGYGVFEFCVFHQCDEYKIYYDIANLTFKLDERGEFYECDELELKLKHVHQLQNLYFALTGTEL